jgi:hypothetical protein
MHSRTERKGMSIVTSIILQIQMNRRFMKGPEYFRSIYQALQKTDG